MTAKIKDGFNFNSLLITIVLAISAWTLKKVVEQGEQQATTNVRVEYQGQAINALDARVQANTRDINTLRH